MSQYDYKSGNKFLEIFPEYKELLSKYIDINREFYIGLTHNKNVKLSYTNITSNNDAVINARFKFPKLIQCLSPEGINTEASEIQELTEEQKAIHPDEEEIFKIFPGLKIYLPEQSMNIWFDYNDSVIRYVGKKKGKKNRTRYINQTVDIDDINASVKKMWLEMKAGSTFDEIYCRYKSNQKIHEECIKKVKEAAEKELGNIASVKIEIAHSIASISIKVKDKSFLLKKTNLLFETPTPDKIVEKLEKNIPNYVRYYNDSNKAEFEKEFAATFEDAVINGCKKYFKYISNIYKIEKVLVFELKNGLKVDAPALKYKYSTKLVEAFKTDKYGAEKYRISDAGKKYIKDNVGLYIGSISDKSLPGYHIKGNLSETLKTVLYEINKYISEYNQMTDRLLNRSEELPVYSSLNQYSYILDKKSVRINFPPFDIIISMDNSVKIKPKEAFKSLKSETKLKSYQQAKKIVKEGLSGYTALNIEGSGILYGKTSLTLVKDNIKKIYNITPDSYKNSLVAWKKWFAKWIKEVENDFDAEKKKQEREFRNRFREYTDSMLAVDIATFVCANERYITANAVCNNLRGLKGTFGGTIKDIGTSGRYNLISSDTVLHTIDEMLANGIFYTVKLKGTYGRFFILKCTNDCYRMLNLKEQEYDPKDVIKKIDTGKGINDFEALCVFKNIKSKNENDIQDYIRLLNLSKVQGFICNYFEDYIEIMSRMPEEFKNYFKIKKKMEEDSFAKKIMTKIEKAVKEKDR